MPMLDKKHAQARCLHHNEQPQAGWLRHNLLLFIMLALFFAAGLVLLPIPFNRDQGIYAYNAWRWLSDDMLYRDTFGHKGPLLYLIYAVGLDLFDGKMWGPNLLDIFARTAAVGLVYATARQILRGRAALLAALFTALPLFGVFNSCWWNAQAETFMLPLLAGSAWLCLRQGKRYGWFSILVAGFLAGQVVMLKPTALIHGIFLGGWLLISPGSSSNTRWKDCMGFNAGLVAAIGIWITYFAVKGALLHLYELLIVFNSIHAAAFESRASMLMRLIKRGFWPIFSLIPLAGLFMFLPVDAGRERRGSIFILAWLAASVLQVALQAKFFLYHWIVVIPAMGLFAGAGLDTLYEALKKLRWRAAAPTAATVILVAFLLNYSRFWFLVQESYMTRDYLLNRITRAEYYSRFNTAGPDGTGDFNFLASAAAASYAINKVPADGTLLVFGYEPVVNFMAARAAPTRFQIDYPLTFIAKTERARRHQEQWRSEFMNDLKKKPPEMVILVDNDTNPLEPVPSIEQAKQFEEFWEWLNNNYHFEAEIEDFTFYRISR